MHRGNVCPPDRHGEREREIERERERERGRGRETETEREREREHVLTWYTHQSITTVIWRQIMHIVIIVETKRLQMINVT